PTRQLPKADGRPPELLQQVEGLRHRRNTVSTEIGQMKEQTQREPLIAEMRGVNAEIGDLEERLREVEARLEHAMYNVPNLPHASVPVGEDESQNIVLRQEGEPKTAE